jgi:uncharacterized protein (TIGR00730 family)
VNPLSTPKYDVDDPKLAGLINQILAELDQFSNLDLLREVFVTGVKLALDDSSTRGDLKILRTAVKEIRHAFRVFAQYRDTPKVSVFGSARSLPDDPEFRLAQQLGQRLAETGYMVITGAGDGIMGAAHLGAGREKSIGLNIMLPFEQSANPTIAKDPKLINFRYFFTRKLFFVKESNAIVLMPGGFGTLDEGFETLTLIQTGKAEIVPIIMLDTEGGGYWKAWKRLVEEQLFGGGYISEDDRSLYLITRSLDEACSEINTFYYRYHSARYVDRRRTLVLRLKKGLRDEQVGVLNRDFKDILKQGKIRMCKAFPEEEDEPSLSSLPRLALEFDQVHNGRLRRLIDVINRF